VTFSGATTGIAYLDYSWSGNIDISPTSLLISGVSFGASISHNGVLTQYSYVLATKECFRYLVANTCVEGNSIIASGSIAIPFSSGEYSITVGFNAGGADGTVTGHASSFLRTTGGVSFNSRSGAFLVDALPISQVPEPSQLVLLITGGAAVFLARKRRERRASCVDAVGTGIAPSPPHRSVRAELPHTALALGTNDQEPPK
jgi:hypothetical protein